MPIAFIIARGQSAVAVCHSDKLFFVVVSEFAGLAAGIVNFGDQSIFVGFDYRTVRFAQLAGAIGLFDRIIAISVVNRLLRIIRIPRSLALFSLFLPLVVLAFSPGVSARFPSFCSVSR